MLELLHDPDPDEAYGRPAPWGGDAGPRLAPLVFTTEGVDLRRRVDLWRGTYDSFNAVSVPYLDGAAFEARNEIWPIGPAALMRNAAPALAFSRTARHIRRDGVDHWVIRVARRGSTRVRVGERSFVAGPMQPILFSLGEPSESDRTAADWVSLYLPRDSFPALAEGLALLGPGPLTGPGAGMLAETMLMLRRRLPELSARQAPLLAEAMRAMAAACLLADVAPGAVTPRDAALARRERIRRVIRDHIGSPTLGPEKICRLAGISRSQLYRLFEPHGGVARYIQAQRLRLAHAALSESGPHAPVAGIAERLGFFDASAFSRAFRREFGCTPSEVRAAAMRGLPPAGGPDAARGLPDADFVAVLRRIGALARNPV